MTPVDLINLALKTIGVLGVGQTAGAEDVNDAFTQLNMMLGQWSVKRNVVHQIADVSLVATGAQTYTVGPGGDFNITRPAKLVGAYLRQLQPSAQYPIDLTLHVVQSMSDYAAIQAKTITSIPSLVYYDPQYPLAVLHAWPVAPATTYELHLLVLMPLAQFATPFDDINLPPEYQEAIMYNLAGRLAPLYGQEPTRSIIALASASLQTVRMANVQTGTLRMPAELTGNSRYNVYSDY